MRLGNRIASPSPSPDASDDQQSEGNQRGGVVAAFSGSWRERSARLRHRAQPFLDFWTKINNDWIFNLAGLLAYNFLMALFPMLLLLLAGFGLVLRTLSLSTEGMLEQRIASVLPPGTGLVIVSGLAAHLKASAGLLLVVGVGVSVVLGSRLFIVLENCFGIIFRLRGRDALQQNGMALGMLLLYLLLVPVVFVLSILPADLIGLFEPHGRSVLGGGLIEAGRLVIALLAALLLFGLTYALVPNRPMRWRTWQQNWKGTVVAAVLLLLYEALFPIYQQRFLQPDNYGSVAAFAVIILLFFYYLAFIVLLGAEINSWAAGQRETATDLAGMLHAVQAHRTVRGAAGPTAGQPQEDMQQHTPSRLTRALTRLVQRVRTRYPSRLRLPPPAQPEVTQHEPPETALDGAAFVPRKCYPGKSQSYTSCICRPACCCGWMGPTRFGYTLGRGPIP